MISWPPGFDDFYKLKYDTDSNISGAEYWLPRPGAGSFENVTGLISGRYYFWVQACHPQNTDACSAFRAGTGNTAVVLTPPSISRNPSSGTEPASFTVS